MKITADELFKLIDACPGNQQASGAGMMRSGRVVRCVSSFDIEALAKKINERMGSKNEQRTARRLQAEPRELARHAAG